MGKKIDERPSFSVRALASPNIVSLPDGTLHHVCLSSIDYPYVMQERMKEAGIMQYKYTGFPYSDEMRKKLAEKEPKEINRPAIAAFERYKNIGNDPIRIIKEK